MTRLTIVGRKGVFQGTAQEWERICARASGRRHYNAMRQLHAALRRQQVLALWKEYDGTHGTQKRIAEQLGVSRATVCRDLKRILRPAWA